jgi:hypothetical protein
MAEKIENTESIPTEQTTKEEELVTETTTPISEEVASTIIEEVATDPSIAQIVAEATKEATSSSSVKTKILNILKAIGTKIKGLFTIKNLQTLWDKIKTIFSTLITKIKALDTKAIIKLVIKIVVFLLLTTIVLGIVNYSCSKKAVQKYQKAQEQTLTKENKEIINALENILY